MKGIYFVIKVALLASTCLFSWAAQARSPLFHVTFIKNNESNHGHLAIYSTTPGRTYPYAGIKILNSNYSLSGCKTIKNGWCIFSTSDTHPASLSIYSRLGINKSNHHFPLNTPSNDNVQVLLSLNAYGNHPVSVEAVTTVSQTPGRIIGYLNGYQTPLLEPADIAAAGYTHVIITVAVFNDTGGTLNLSALSAFSDFNSSSTTSLASYISQLHSAGLKVLLSIGGASTSISNTTVSFYTAEFGVGSAPDYNPALFQSNLISNLKNLTDTYGFDGFDFDIESGLYAGSSFTDPGSNCSMSVLTSPCTSYYLANIINTLYDTEYSYAGQQLLLSLAPQLANISATSTYNNPYALYSALSMQTYASLAWSAFQNYNAGTFYGINTTIYPIGSATLTSTPDAAVAAAVDILASWPQNTSLGFLPYIGDLVPSQVVIGYAINSNNGDGSPVAVPAMIQNAIECLRSNNYCDTYTPPATYPSIGGVFAFTLNSDAEQNYAFATSLYPCVVEGICTYTAPPSS